MASDREVVAAWVASLLGVEPDPVSVKIGDASYDIVVTGVDFYGSMTDSGGVAAVVETDRGKFRIVVEPK